MNKEVEKFIKKELKSGLSKLPKKWQKTFRLMYDHKNKYLDINGVVDNLKEDKLDWALSQVQNSLKKLSKPELVFNKILNKFKGLGG